MQGIPAQLLAMTVLSLHTSSGHSMNKPSRSSTVVRYILGVLLAEALLLLAAFITAGIAIRSMSFPLGFWGIVALLVGVWRLASSEPEDISAAAVKAMHGRAGAHPLANYTSRQEYKLTKLREEQTGPEPDVQSPEAFEHAASHKELDRLVAVSVFIAGALAVMLSWLAGRVFPR